MLGEKIKDMCVESKRVSLYLDKLFEPVTRNSLVLESSFNIIPFDFGV